MFSPEWMWSWLEVWKILEECRGEGKGNCFSSTKAFLSRHHHSITHWAKKGVNYSKNNSIHWKHFLVPSFHLLVYLKIEALFYKPFLAQCPTCISLCWLSQARHCISKVRFLSHSRHNKKMSYDDELHLPESGSMVQCVSVDAHSAVFAQAQQQQLEKFQVCPISACKVKSSVALLKHFVHLLSMKS